jgi:hypothetical protein
MRVTGLTVPTLTNVLSTNHVMTTPLVQTTLARSNVHVTLDMRVMDSTVLTLTSVISILMDATRMASVQTQMDPSSVHVTLVMKEMGLTVLTSTNVPLTLMDVMQIVPVLIQSALSIVHVTLVSKATGLIALTSMNVLSTNHAAPMEHVTTRTGHSHANVTLVTKGMDSIVLISTNVPSIPMDVMQMAFAPTPLAPFSAPVTSDTRATVLTVQT